MGILIGLNFVLVLCGYLFPVPSLVLAWREWLRGREIPPVKAWRRVASQVALWLLCSGIALWIYAIVREAVRHDYSYMMPSASVG